MIETEPRVLLDDLVFAEGPRWHDGRLWFSDMHAREVVAVDENGARETIVEVPGGEVTHRIDLPDRAGYACALGGDDRRTLFLLEAFDSNPHHEPKRGNGRIRTLRVETPGAGLP